MRVEITLLDYMAYRAGCPCLSDLHSLDPVGRARLCRLVECLEPAAASPREWQDAAAYLSGRPASSAPEEARAQLLAALAAK